MIKVILPATNHKPHWVELTVDGHHAGRIWAHSTRVDLNTALGQFHVIICGEDGVSEAYLWADAIEKAEA
jgi:hypothetical protein